MNRYEMLYILNASLTDEARAAAMEKLESVITSSGGKIESVDKWGVKKLAYEIDDMNEGFYVLMTFESQPTLIAEIERVAGIADEVIRRMITKL